MVVISLKSLLVPMHLINYGETQENFMLSILNILHDKYTKLTENI